MPVRGQYDTFGDLIARVNIKYPQKYTTGMLDEMRKIFAAGKSVNLNDQL